MRVNRCLPSLASSFAAMTISFNRLSVMTIPSLSLSCFKYWALYSSSAVYSFLFSPGDNCSSVLLCKLHFNFCHHFTTYFYLSVCVRKPGQQFRFCNVYSAPSQRAAWLIPSGSPQPDNIAHILFYRPLFSFIIPP